MKEEGSNAAVVYEIEDGSDRPKSSTERVYRELRKRIISGEIPPGERLKVEALKALLDTGATPIREALSLLTSDQLVERLDQRGFRAAPASQRHFDEILGLRCQIDILALNKSMADGGTEWEERLVLSNHRLNQFSDANLAEYEYCHKAFHMALLAGCGSPILIKFCDQLYDLNVRYRYLAGTSTQYKKRNISNEHQLIVDAAVARDVDLANKHLLNHYNKTGDFLSELIG